MVSFLSKRYRAASLVLAIALVGAMQAGPAMAAGVRVNGGTLEYLDNSAFGEANNAVVTRLGATEYRVTDAVAMSVGAGCFSEGSTSVRCNGVTTSVYVEAGLGNDRVTVNQSNSLGSRTLSLHGEDGSDTLQGDDTFDRITGGNGDDVVTGRLGADTLSGGPGRDTLNYFDGGTRTTRVSVSGSAGGSEFGGGGSGEGDTSDGTFERIVGGNGPDFLLNARPGKGPGPMEIIGNPGNDVIVAAGFGLREEAGDVLRGFDGDDHIYARDGFADTVNCGGGIDDFAEVDLADLRSPGSVVNCERQSTAPAGAGPNVRIARRARVRGNRARLRLRCPRSSRTPGVTRRDTRRKSCKGTVRLGGVRKRFRIRLGKRATVRVRLSRSLRRKLRTRRRLRVKVVAVERVHPKGPNTTVERVSLRR